MAERQEQIVLGAVGHGQREIDGSGLGVLRDAEGLGGRLGDSELAGEAAAEVDLVPARPGIPRLARQIEQAVRSQGKEQRVAVLALQDLEVFVRRHDVGMFLVRHQFGFGLDDHRNYPFWSWAFHARAKISAGRRKARDRASPRRQRRGRIVSRRCAA
jgi:hypothetical protein